MSAPTRLQSNDTRRDFLEERQKLRASELPAEDKASFVDAFLEMNVPSFAVGVTHRGPYKNGPGEINCPIAIGGMVIMPGDLVLGDADGVVVVPIDDVAEVYERTVAKHAAENKQMENIKAGTHKPTWFNDALAKAGCELPAES
ncbi:hypothetical protein MZK49_26395 [Ensifer sesbaniae]|nr:hypothetical protein [Ensifer sesbaniae]